MISLWTEMMLRPIIQRTWDDHPWDKNNSIKAGIIAPEMKYPGLDPKQWHAGAGL